MNDQIIVNDKEFVTHKGYANNLTDKYLERRYESEYTSSGTQFIDLGLPSGTLWADRNIGADAPEDYGDHFRWGETTPFTENSDDYEYRDLGENIAGTEYDVATSMLSKGYQMPTDEQLKELKHYCTWEQSTINGIYGMKVIGPSGNSIFLPAAGFRYSNSSSLAAVGLRGSLAAVGSGGYYWIATHDNLTCGKKRGNYLMFNSFFCMMALYDRGCGSSVRPVITVNQVSNTKRIQLVDLGLLSGTLWADRNIGADYPENYGYHFRWGETSSFDGSSGIYKCRDLGENIAGTEYDAATSILGKGFQMPTHEQQKELVDCCTWEWSTVYGFKGMKVTGPNGNSIFLPAAGYRDYHSCSLDYVGLKGCYWSATPVFTYDGHYLEFDSGNQSCYGNSRSHGFTVRPVAAT